MNREIKVDLVIGEHTYPTEFTPVEKKDGSNVNEIMSTFGSDFLYLADEDIEHIRNGGYVGVLGEYGIVIAHKDALLKRQKDAKSRKSSALEGR